MLGSASSWGAGVRDEASESQQWNGRETYDAGSLQRPPCNGGPSTLDSHKGCRKRGDKWDEGDNTERRGRSRRFRDRDEKPSNGDSDRGKGIPIHGSGEALSDPDQARRREDADSAYGENVQAHHEG